MKHTFCLFLSFRIWSSTTVDRRLRSKVSASAYYRDFEAPGLKMGNNRNRNSNASGGGEKDIDTILAEYTAQIEHLKWELTQKLDIAMSTFLELAEKVKKLEEQGQKREERISSLELEITEIKKKAKIDQEKTNELEQTLRNNNVILKGAKIRTMAQVVGNARSDRGSDGDGRTNINRGQANIINVIEFAKQNGVNMDKEDIKSVSAFLKKDRNGAQTELATIRFKDETSKKKFLQVKKTLWERRSKDIFINDDLTALNSNIAFNARRLKKDNKIEDMWSHEGRIYIRKLQADGGQVLQIKNIEHFAQFD